MLKFFKKNNKGPFMKHTSSLVFLALFLALSAGAEVLVYEGFHPADYGNVSANGNVGARVDIGAFEAGASHTLLLVQ